jgi:hypothetical protein
MANTGDHTETQKNTKGGSEVLNFHAVPFDEMAR